MSEDKSADAHELAKRVGDHMIKVSPVLHHWGVELTDIEPGRVEIVSGLAPGDEVVTAGQMKIFDGAPVRAIPATGLGEASQP